jgi:general secretion pathway protein A
MYLDHYHLKEKPFQISADPRFLWLGDKHKEALAILKYGIFDNRGFLLLSGDVGTGKTTLIHALLKSLGEDTLVAMVPDPGLSQMEFFHYISKAFGISKDFTTKEQFLGIFRQFLLLHETQSKKVLLIIDEAQRLTPELLEEVRLLSNIEKDYTKLLNIFFVGQNEFNDIILEQRNRPLRQRITINYNINPLEPSEVANYINFRLSVAGCRDELFSSQAIREIYRFSDGYPRLINIVCDHALLTGFVRGEKQISAQIARECADELKIRSFKFAKGRAPEGAGAPPAESPPAPLPAPVPAPPPVAPPAKAKPGLAVYAVIIALLCFIAGYLLYRDPIPVVVGPSGVPAAVGADATSPGPAAPLPAPANPPAVKVADGIAEEDISAPPRAAPEPAGREAAAAAPRGAGAVAGTANPIPAVVPADPVVVHFQIDSNELEPAALDRLETIPAVLQAHPGVSLDILGYADAIGNLHYNVKVSEFRANIVKTYLVGKGVDPARISTLGKGSADPVASNDTTEGRRRNRRVEIVFRR